MGLSTSYDIKLTYAKIISNRLDITNLLVIYPKRYLIKDILSVSLPLGFYVGEGLTITLGPKLIFTYPILNNFDISLSAKAEYLILYLCLSMDHILQAGDNGYNDFTIVFYIKISSKIVPLSSIN